MAEGMPVLGSRAVVEEDPSIDLLGLLVTFLAEWKIGLICGVLAFAAGATYTYLTKPQFVAVATILPKQTFAESNTVSTLFSGRHPEDLYSGLLRSRTVTDNVIRELGWIPPGSRQSWEDTRGFLNGSITTFVGTDGLLRIFARNGDAKMAMRIANAYLDGLNQQQQTMAMSQSALNRQFFQQQLDREREALTTAENDLATLQRRSGVIEAGTQTQIGLNQIAGTRSAITGLEVQLAALLQSATEDNPQVKTLRSQIEKLRAQEHTMEASGTSGTGAPTAAGRAPEVNLLIDRAQRQVRFHEGLLQSLSGQFQNARMAESASVDAFQVVDYAIEPERKAFPPRGLWLMFSVGFGVFMGALSIVFVLVKRRVQADLDYQRHMLEIRRNFRFRRR